MGRKMGSYITGILVALVIVSGLYLAMQTRTTTATTRMRQDDKLESLPSEKLRGIAIDPEASNRVEAIFALGNNPGELKKTVPCLAKLTMDRDDVVQIASASALQTIGEPAVEHFKKFVDSEMVVEIKFASSAIRAIGPACDVYLPQVQRWLASDDTKVKTCGVFALQGMGREAALDSMPGLIDCLHSDHSASFNLQCMACRVLEKLGPDALDAEEALLKLLEEGNISTKGWAAICLGAIGPTASDVDISELLHGKLKTSRVASEYERLLIAFAHLGPEGAEALGTIREIADQHRDSSVKSAAAFAVWQIAGDSEEALGTLRGMITQDETAIMPIETVGRLGEQGLPLLDELIGSLDGHSPAIREAAVVAIGNMGPAAKRALPAVTKLLEDSDPLVKGAAKLTIRDLNRKPDEDKKGRKKK